VLGTGNAHAQIEIALDTAKDARRIDLTNLSTQEMRFARYDDPDLAFTPVQLNVAIAVRVDDLPQASSLAVRAWPAGAGPSGASSLSATLKSR
jgi:hypothetical protein